MKENLAKWSKTVVVGGLGGGIAATVAMLSDPSKYSFPKDLGSGKAWPFFISGSAMAIGGLLLKSPFGQQMVGSLHGAQAQLEESKQTIAKTKADLKTPKK